MFIQQYQRQEIVIYMNIQNNAIINLPDGKPLSIIAKFYGHKNIERVTGPDFMEEIFKISENEGYKHYFYGSTEDTLNKMIDLIKIKYPNISIEGYYSPPFKSNVEIESKEFIDNINNLNVDFLWVGLGAPKQEEWMAIHHKKINALMIGVGAGFDYHAGNIKRAPNWIQNCSLEWVYRLLQDPKRLFRRYLSTNFSFLILIIKQLLKFK